MKIISYNIRNGFYAMGHETKDGFWTSEGKFNFVPFLKWVKKEDPDVILLQELTFRGVTKIKFEADMKKLGFVHIAYGFAADKVKTADIDQNVWLSDHFPVISEIEQKKKKTLKTKKRTTSKKGKKRSTSKK